MEIVAHMRRNGNKKSLLCESYKTEKYKNRNWWIHLVLNNIFFHFFSSKSTQCAFVAVSSR